MIIYSFKKKKINYSKEIRSSFSNSFFEIKFLVRGNDYSIFSFALLNFFSLLLVQENIYFELKKNFIKTELSFFLKETSFFGTFFRKFKNFSKWNETEWISKKENCTRVLNNEKNIFEKICLDSKNIHAWKLFFKNPISKFFVFWKILILIEILKTSDFMNNSMLNFQMLLCSKSKKFGSFFYKVKRKYRNALFVKFPNDLSDSCNTFLKIKNNRLDILKKII